MRDSHETGKMAYDVNEQDIARLPPGLGRGCKLL